MYIWGLYSRKRLGNSHRRSTRPWKAPGGSAGPSEALNAQLMWEMESRNSVVLLHYNNDLSTWYFYDSLCGCSWKRTGAVAICEEKKKEAFTPFEQSAMILVVQTSPTLPTHGPGMRASSTPSRMGRSIPRPVIGGYKRGVEVMLRLRRRESSVMISH